jgi:O-antigen/teichoic acid export membrane protein
LQAEGGSFDNLRKRLIELRTTLVGAFGVMMVAVTVASALNYVFSIIMTRMLGETGAFASFNSLNAIFLIVSMGAFAVQTVVTKYVAEFEVTDEREKTRVLIHVFSKWLVVLSVIIIAASFAVAWPIADALKLTSPLFVIIVGTSLAITIYLTLPYGMLQGQQKFIGLGAASVASAVLRITFGVVLVAVGLDVYGALGAATIAGVCVGGVIVYYYRDFFRGKVKKIEGFHPGKAFLTLVPVTIAIFLVIFMTQIDVVLIKALKGALDADRYSYGALAGKAVLFFPMGITMVMFPRVSELRAKGEPTGRVLAWSLAACLLLEGAVVGFYALFPGFTATFFAGKHGKEISSITGILGTPFVVLFGLVMAVFAMLNVLVYYHLALDRRAFIAILAVGAAVEVAGIMMFNSTLPQVLLVMLVVGVTLLVVNLLLAFKKAPLRPDLDSVQGVGPQSNIQSI